MKQNTSDKSSKFFFFRSSEVHIPPAPPPCNGPGPGQEPATTEFQDIVDRESRAFFSRMDRSTWPAWGIIALASSNIHEVNGAAAIVNLLQQGGRYCLGFPVNNLEHCLQTATRAVTSGAPNEFVLAALLHDVAIPISYHGHAQVAASIIRPYVSEAVYQTVLHHEEFALAHYGDAIGQPTNMRDLYRNESWYGAAENFVDNWVQLSYDPNFNSMPLSTFIPLIEQSFAPHDPEKMEVTMGDCFTEQVP